MKAHMKYQTNLKEVELTAKTPHGKVGYWGKVRAVCANEIDQYCNKKKFDSLCRTGCPNYGQKWSCHRMPHYIMTFQNNIGFCVSCC